MKTTAIAIEPHPADVTSFSVSVSIGTELHTFILNVQIVSVAGREVQAVSGNDAFEQTFAFNPHLSLAIGQLVSNVYNQETVELPVELGDFGTDEAAIAMQKPFKETSLSLTQTQHFVSAIRP